MSASAPKKALVTGGAGFLGSHLCRRLLSDGYSVVCMDDLSTGSERNVEGTARAAADAGAAGRFVFVRHDVAEPYGGEYDEIYNLACPASPPHYQADPPKTFWTSVGGMRNALALARETGAKVLHASTSEIYGDPLVHPQPESYWGNVNTIGVRSCYDEGKRAAETMAADCRRAFGVDVRMVRIFNTYGPLMHPEDGRVVTNFAMQALRGEDITVYGDGLQTRSFQYCDDLVEAMRLYMEKPRAEIDAFFARHGLGAPVLNVGNPGEFTMLELADLTVELVDESSRRLGLPPTRSKVVHRPLPGDDPKMRRPDVSLAKELLGWAPKVALRDGLARTIESFRSIPTCRQTRLTDQGRKEYTTRQSSGTGRDGK